MNKRERKKSSSSDKKQMWIQAINAWSTLTLAVSTIILVGVTAYYAGETHNLSETAAKQMLLSAEPNIELECDSSNKITKIKDEKVKFTLVNLSPVDLKNIKLYSKYYTHVIDSNLNECFLTRGIIVNGPESDKKEIKGNESIPIEFDYKRSGPINNDQNYYYIGNPPNAKSYSAKDVNNNFYTITYAEYKIDFQREIDGKDYSQTFYYLIPVVGDLLVRQASKEDVLNINRFAAWNSQLAKTTASP